MRVNFYLIQAVIKHAKHVVEATIINALVVLCKRSSKLINAIAKHLKSMIPHLIAFRVITHV